MVNKALAAQEPLTTPQALNVRGYDPRSGRDRGAQRAGLTKYIPVMVNGTQPVQMIDHAVSTGAAVNTAAGVGSIALMRTTAVGMELYNNGGTNRFFDTANTCLGTCWDNINGIAFGAMSDGATFTRLTAGKPDGTVLWTSANLPNFNTARVVGMAFGSGAVWVATVNAGATATFVYKLDSTLGTILNGGTHIYTTSKIISSAATSGGGLSYCNGILALGYTDGTVDYLNTMTGVAKNAAVMGGGDNVQDIDTDGTFFYMTSSGGHAAKTDSNGNSSWNIAITNFAGGTNPSVCFDSINNVVAVSFTKAGPLGSVATLNPSSGAQISVFTVLASTACYCVRPNGSGGYQVNTNAASNFGSVTNTGTTNWQATVAIVNTTRCLSVNQGQGASSLVSLSPRYVRGLAVSGGTLVRTLTGVGSVAITGGSNALNPAAKAIFGAQLGQQFYFADGVNFGYYDCPTDSFLTLAASSGSLPRDSHGNAPRLITVWRTRLVFSGLPFDPFNWFMSAVGDATNWNYLPLPTNETQAVAGNNSTAGMSPDIVNALIPYSDEILYFGCDHSFWQMTGDPAAGGRIDLVSDAIGVAWGKAWCRDGQGILYFMSSRGSVYSYAPGGIPTMISQPIYENLVTINVASSIVRMEWSERHFGFHLFITPVSGPAPTSHYFYDTRNGSWWQDQFANLSHSPLATHAMDGDTPGERLILLGGQDGFIRVVNPAALDDDGTAINTNVILGPVRNKNFMRLKFAYLQCGMDANSAPVNYNVFGGADAQSALSNPLIANPNPFPALPNVQPNGILLAGRNHDQAISLAGHSLWVQFWSQNAGQAWALEWAKGRMRVPDGKAAQRQF